MMTAQEQKRHDELIEKARSIVNFRMHRTIYFLSNILIWLVSIFLYFAFEVTWVWAIFPSSIWLVILIFHYLYLFKWNHDQVEKEYQKLVLKAKKAEEKSEQEIQQ